MIAQAWLAYAAWGAVVAAGTALYALYCGNEMGVYVINKIRLDLRAEAGNRNARLLRRLLGAPDRLLTVLLIGTNLSSYAVAFAVAAILKRAGCGDMTEWYDLAIVTPLLFIFGDSVPKNVFRRLAETLTYRLSWFLAASAALLTVTGVLPLIRSLSWLAMLPARARRPHPEGRLDALLAEGSAGGALTHIQSVMADRVMGIADVTLADAMVPMDKVVWIGRHASRQELLALVQKSNYARLPVRDETGAVVGVLDIYDVLTEPDLARPADRMTEPLKLSATTTVTEAIYRMQRTHKMMAVVQSADRPVGIVTIKDLVEEIVGELEEW